MTHIKFFMAVLITCAARAHAQVEYDLSLLHNQLSMLEQKAAPTKEILKPGKIKEAQKLSAATIERLTKGVLTLFNKKELTQFDYEQIEQSSKRLHDDYFAALARGDMQQLQEIHTAFHHIYMSRDATTQDLYKKIIIAMLKGSGFTTPTMNKDTIEKVVSLEVEFINDKINDIMDMLKTRPSDITDQQFNELEEKRNLLEKLRNSAYFSQQFPQLIKEYADLIAILSPFSKNKEEMKKKGYLFTDYQDVKYTEQKIKTLYTEYFQALGKGDAVQLSAIHRKLYMLYNILKSQPKRESTFFIEIFLDSGFNSPNVDKASEKKALIGLIKVINEKLRELQVLKKLEPRRDASGEFLAELKELKNLIKSIYQSKNFAKKFPELVELYKNVIQIL